MRHLFIDHNKSMHDLYPWICCEPKTVVFWITDHFVFFTHYTCNAITKVYEFVGSFEVSHTKYYKNILERAMDNSVKGYVRTNTHRFDESYMAMIKYGKYTRSLFHDIHYLEPGSPDHITTVDRFGIYTQRNFTLNDLDIDFEKAGDIAYDFVLSHGLDKILLKDISELIIFNRIDTDNHQSCNSIDKLIKLINNDYKNSSKLEGVI